MAASVLVDASFVVALFNRRDSSHRWAATQSANHARPWLTCEAAISEAFFLLGPPGVPALRTLLRRGVLRPAFDLGDQMDSIMELMEKYASVPMSLADACLVRMTETLSNPLLLTTDTDFRIYRRHSRHVVPCVMPD
jgi:uncharacterized protein